MIYPCNLIIIPQFIIKYPVNYLISFDYSTYIVIHIIYYDGNLRKDLKFNLKTKLNSKLFKINFLFKTTNAQLGGICLCLFCKFYCTKL